SCSAPRRSGCATRSARASTATISRKDARSRSRSSARKAPNRMPASTNIAPRAGYPAQLLAVSWHALAQLVRTPSHSRRAEAARKLARHSLWLSVAGAALVIALMLAFDQTEIEL